MGARAVVLDGAAAVDIVAGSVFLFAGLAVCCVALLLRRSGTRIFAWLGMWSAVYGAVQLTQAQPLVAVSGRWLQVAAPYANTAMTYFSITVASLSFLELSLGAMRVVLRVTACLGLAITIAGIALLAAAGSTTRLMPYNNLIAACLLGILMVVVAVPALAGKYLVLSNRKVLAAGMMIFGLEALYNSVSHLLGLNTARVLDHIGFAVLLLCFAYVAIQMVLTKERRLLAVENELAIARDIQASILPETVPELNHARISAVYRPMTAVAGDFYEFIAVDRDRAGFLVADVCGHGVPAALIASMIKVAVRTIVPCADDPAAVLRGLNRVLSGTHRGQLVSAAYLWIDMESRRAMYSAAGHPPLLRWRDGRLDRIESNGIVFGVTPEIGDYPVRAMSVTAGDRFLLYTDGVTESQDINGDFFGDARLEQVVRSGESCTPAELSERLLAGIQQWRPASVSQQDDITLIVIDVAP